MPLVADRVKETTATTGTGTVTLAGASSGYRAFSSAFSNSDTVYYCLVSGTAWEVGIGTYNTNTLSRDTVHASSAGGTTKISLTGTSDVFNTLPATSILNPSITTLSISGQLTSTLATGTAPLSVSSTTRVANLNVATAGTADQVVNALTMNNGGSGAASGSTYNGSSAVTISYNSVGALSSSTTSTQSGYFGDIYLYDDSTPSHYLQITNSANLTLARTLSINVNDANRAVSLSGDLTVSAAATISGTNTGDVTLATNHGLSLTNQVIGMGTPSSITGSSTNSVTTTTHTHAIAIGSTTDKVVITTTSGALTTATLSGLSLSTGTLSVTQVPQSHILKFDTGTTEGTDLYTFNGSTAKTIDIKAGNQITLTKAAGAITIAVSEGAGSGLDADTVDSYHVGTSGSTIPLLNTANTWSADQTISGMLKPTYIKWGSSWVDEYNLRLTPSSSVGDLDTYFDAGEGYEILQITPAGSSANYLVTGSIYDFSSPAEQKTDFILSVRSNTLPDLSWTLKYTTQSSQATIPLEPVVWVKETTTASIYLILKARAGVANIQSQGISFKIFYRGDYAGAVVTGTHISVTTPYTNFTEYAGDEETKLDNSGNFTARGQLISSVTTGTAPLSVSSTTAVTNLNADMLDGYHIGTSGTTVPLLSTANTWGNNQTIGVNSAGAALSVTNAGAGASISVDKQIVSSLATGTAPLSVASTTAVTNLNADMIDGVHLAGLMQTSHAANSITGFGASATALGASAAGTATTVSRSDHVHANPTLDSLSNVTITANASGEILKWNGSAWINNTLTEAGIVSSVALSLPSIFTVSGSPVTTTGTLTGALATQSGATVFAGPTANTAAPTAAAPTFRNLEMTDIPGAAYKKSCVAATTAALTLNAATATIDGVTLAASDRVLIKDQATASQNGIYYDVTTTLWKRCVDADTAGEIAGGVVAIDNGTTNGGNFFKTNFKTTDTLGTTAMNWYQLVDSRVYSATNTWSGNNTFSKAIIEAKTAPTISANTLTLNLTLSGVFAVSLNANITTLTISNPAASGSVSSFILEFTADGTARTVTWPSAVKWSGGVAPTLTSTNGKKDAFMFYTYDAGTTYIASIIGQNF